MCLKWSCRDLLMCLESSEEVAWCDLSQVCPTGPLGLRAVRECSHGGGRGAGTQWRHGLSSELVLLGKTSHN